ncbi:MAG: anti-sigma factor, partial [Pseudomonadota bacterium]
DDPELKALSEGLHQLYDPVLAEPLPAHWLRARRWRAYALAAGWVLAGLAVGAIAGWQLRGWRATPVAQAEAPVPAFVKRAAVAHATYSPEVRHPVEVGADQEAHLVAWLSKRLGASLRAPHLESVGYSLVGGRLLPGDGSAAGAAAPVAHFMYQNARGTRVTLYVRTNASENRETAFRYSSEGNVKVFYWIDRKLGYAISSADIDKETLLKVAHAAYQQLNPE